MMTKEIVKRKSPTYETTTRLDNSNEDLGCELVKDDEELNKTIGFRTPIIWRNVLAMVLLHAFGLYGWYLMVRYVKWQSLLWSYAVAQFGAMGVLAGSHRLWTHRAYKAHWSLRVLLMIMQTTALQFDIYDWVRDHRVHHKYSETNADPHNSRRGFFFAHMGWLLCRKHPAVKEKGKQINMFDVWDDPIVRFQRRFYIPLVLLFWGFIPVAVPHYLWGEKLSHAFFGSFCRYVMSLHQTWLVNSAAHIFGSQLYNLALRPRENRLVTYLAMGEGYHNYHHTFPWDYSASEYGWRYNFNLATLLIDTMACLGLATQLREVPREVIEQKIASCGDASLMPPHLSADRKPKWVLLDLTMGLLFASWQIWLSLSIRWMIFSGMVVSV